MARSAMPCFQRFWFNTPKPHSEKPKMSEFKQTLRHLSLMQLIVAVVVLDNWAMQESDE